MGSATGGNVIDRATFEKEWANAEARNRLSNDDRALWDTCKYTVRPYIYYNKILIAWTLLKGQPQISDVFSVTSVNASFQDGLWVRVQSQVTQRECVINQTPRRVLGLNVFAWVPYFNEVRYVGPDWNDPDTPRNMRLSVCFKTRHKPDDCLIEGQTYLSELHVFRERFPQYSEVRF